MIFKLNSKKKKKIEKEKKQKLFSNSSILNNYQKKKKIKKFICYDKDIKSELKYRMTRDGISFNTFYSKCDNISPNLLLFKNNNGEMFHGKKRIVKK